ncbi:histidine triad nucleotide-binding protein [Alicyclobacillus ferrooxydans]|uniref:HIT family hydrolase n=1 Tax=Alicyclobacillus ferrooxydans TaxID=471514 RepID=A0A0P9CVC9_9BACL|nr:histidine triad nucleotide-binding protein [Alicyclobacillus ferrooxydans]KPV43635.1 HIT family hydrolase [Alicyclobacillus ferrooxydans]
MRGSENVTDCLFCKIVSGEVPSNKVLETDDVLAFHDIRPQAPVHVLVIPKKHIPSAHHIEASDAAALLHIHEAAQKVAEELGIAENGYRLVTNIGFHGQQTVAHLHYHVLGGRQLQWPPG